MWLWLCIISACLPMVAATEQPFPSIPFATFSQFIQQNFSSNISLATVLMLLFSMTENVSLLSLHCRQQNASCRGENSTQASGWIKALSRAMQSKVGENQLQNFIEIPGDPTDEHTTTSLAMKLDSLAKLLKLYPCSKNGKFKGMMKPVADNETQAVHILCPDSAVCETLSCKPRSLLQRTKARDIPMVTLIKNFRTYQNVPLLSGYCPDCQTTYYADHERTPSPEPGKFDKVYLNSAKYIKIGQTMWADHIFTSAVLSGIYNFHSSAGTYAEFWNSASGADSLDSGVSKVTHRHIWQAFIQESICFVAAESGINLTLSDGLSIQEATKEAFYALGNSGIIQTALEHSCAECTQKYKDRAEDIANNDPSAVVGMEDAAVPQRSGANRSRPTEEKVMIVQL